MNKQQLLSLEQNSHLSIAEVGKKRPELAKSLDERVEKVAQRAMIARLGGKSDKLRNLAATIKIPVGGEPKEIKLHEFTLKALRDAAAKDPLIAEDAGLKKELEELEKASKSSRGKSDRTLADSLRLNKPIARNPEFRSDLQKARLYRMSDAAGLGNKTAEVLVNEFGSVTNINEDKLKQLIKERKLSAKDAKTAGRASSFYHLLDGSAELVAAVMSGNSDLRDLVKLDKDTWIKIITDSKTKPPRGLAPAAYAELLSKRVERLFPGDALANRLSKADVVKQLKAHAGLAKLRKLNQDTPLIGLRDFAKLKTKGISSSELKDLKAGYNNLVQLSHRYPGMRLDAVLDDNSLSEAKKIAEVTRRTNLIQAFFADNQQALTKDLTPRSADIKQLKFGAGTSSADKAMVLSTIRAYQRAHSVAGEVAATEALVAAGFHSAIGIANVPTNAIARQTGLDLKAADRYKARAKEIAAGVHTRVVTIMNFLGDESRKPDKKPDPGKNDSGKPAKGDQSRPEIAEITDYLKEIPGFADFFGNQDFCNCQHCQSILGPAAYFVDLMYFIDENISERFFGSTKHKLKLETRRPDLWTLELTCENTNEEIPYLVIINEILENAVARDNGLQVFNDRGAVAKKVYKEALATKVDSFAQPFNLPFEEVRIYLRHFDRTLADVAEAGNVSGTGRTRLRLGLSPQDFEVISSPDARLTSLKRIYGIEFNSSGGTIKALDAQEFLEPMGVTRDELGELVATRFVTGATDEIHIVSTKRSDESIQNDIETVKGLTRAALDRMHRFVRLWRATGWRIGELDLVLIHLIKERKIPGEPDPRIVIGMVAQVHRLQTKLGISVEELIALWSPLPTDAIVRSVPNASRSGVDQDPFVFPTPHSDLARLTEPLFDRRFGKGRQWISEGTTFLHPALAVAPADVDPNLHELKLSTGTDDDQLYQLIIGLALPLGIDPKSTNDDEKTFALTRDNLSLLYRHARIAALLKISIPELFALMALEPGIALAHIDGPADLFPLMEVTAWWKTTKWTLAELIEYVRPGLPAIATSIAPLVAIAKDSSITYRTSSDGNPATQETINLVKDWHLDKVVHDWNQQATQTRAYRSDDRGLPRLGGTFLSISTLQGGADSRIQINLDTASIFKQAPSVTPGRLPGAITVETGVAPSIPGSFSGVDFPARLPRPEIPSPQTLADELVNQVRESKALEFADTVFTLLPPTGPTAISTPIYFRHPQLPDMELPFAGTAAGETVTYQPVINSRVEPAETITFSANANLDKTIADWNSKATFTRAFRSDSAGQEAASGTRLSFKIKEATGSDTQLIITNDLRGIFTSTVPKEYKGKEVTQEHSRALIAANLNLIESAGMDGRYRLKSGFDPNTTIKQPEGFKPVRQSLLRNILKSYHARTILLALLPSRIGVKPDIAAELMTMLGVDLNGSNFFRELRGDTPPNEIAALIGRLQCLAGVFAEESVFHKENLTFIRQHRQLFEVIDFERLSTTALRRIEMFRSLTDTWLNRSDEAPDLKAILKAFDKSAHFDGANQQDLAALVGCDVGLLQSVHSQLNLPDSPFEALRELIDAVMIAKHIGIGGSTLKQIQSADYADLASASVALQAAFRAKYEDEAEWEKTVEPFRDALLSLRRDGLVAYLLHSSKEPFDEVSDLYYYLLLDVQLEGCARTSRVAAAIDTLHLYVQRCLMNFEESGPEAANRVHVLPEAIPIDEWSWRKNYRVWEANRKIFLYPENYLEPELRDNKTPLFKTLEEELLSKEITNEAILEAYSRYLRGFDELAHLAIAGSYHEKDTENQRDVLHLLGVTSEDPPTYYYRRVDDAHYGVDSQERATHWGAWEKLNIQVPVRIASPLIHRGQLYIFWIRYVTKPQNKFKNGDSKFTGYQHRAYVEFSRRKLDGSWTTPQKVRLAADPFTPDSFPESYQDDGVVLDPLVPKESTAVETFFGDFITYSDYQPLYDDKVHMVPKDDYQLRGFNWERLYPSSGDRIYLRGVNFQMWSEVDLYRLEIGPRKGADGINHVQVPWLGDETRVEDLPDYVGAPLPPALVWSQEIEGRRVLHSPPFGVPCFDLYSYASILIKKETLSDYNDPLAELGPDDFTDDEWDEDVIDYLSEALNDNKIADISLDANLDVVNGSVGDVIIQTSKDVFYLQTNARSDGKCHLRRLNTSLSEDIVGILFNEGLEELLATITQLFRLKEHETDLNLVSGKIYDATKTGKVDYQGAMGEYLREIFFHIPYLIANHLNSQGRFDDAQHWYHYIFDPTASVIKAEGMFGFLLTPFLVRDRKWRYREFIGLTLESFRAQLTDRVALEEYKRDPFNPHAIARLRVSAYQKAIVMKYVDNLLDAGDDLFARAFAQLNPEYLREATLKYVIAQEILGARPARLGDCGEGKVTPKNYHTIKTARPENSEFLTEIESVVSGEPSSNFVINTMVSLDATDAAGLSAAILAGMTAGATKTAGQSAARATAAGPFPSGKPNSGPAITRATIYEGFHTESRSSTLNWGLSLVRQMGPVFCVPENEKMFGYWDRVEDRLYKLRHCQDIEGNFRRLPLFAPPIDPGLLVGATASGLSLDDILGASAGNLPPYRFRFLIEKARSFVSAVQSFGAALLSALEKRDTEELAQLRNVHEKNILTLTTDLRKNERKSAEENLEVVTRRLTAAQYRRDYYAGLVASGLTGAETTQSAAQLTVMGVKAVQLLLAMASGTTYLVPQVGAPTSMKYGGKEIGDSLSGYMAGARIVGEIAEITGEIAGMVASFERREQEWNHQKALAQHDLQAVEKEVKVAELRLAIESRLLELHDKTKAQHDEIMEFFGARFSNLGLYTHLSRKLQELHREAYNNALALCQLVEDAYHFERPGDNSFFVGGEWDSSFAGLLAGERLQMALNRMERSFIETDRRQAEINQSFSVGQIAPHALINLRESGSCEFLIPEFYFDLFYPGQYRRRIQAVRLTVPCVTGPYTNVSVKLTLLRSHLRKDARVEPSNLIEVPPNRTSSVAISSGQADAGVFELNFRDERYQPFEGAGAVSEWRLELPSNFRPFDYQSISDVILTISYTAEEDAGFRTKIEEHAGVLEEFLKNHDLTRVFSLRQEFPNAYNQLRQSPAGTPATMDITDRHFPLFLQGRALTVIKTTMVLAVVDRNPVNAVSLSLNDVEAKEFSDPVVTQANDKPFGELPYKVLDKPFDKGLKRSQTLVINNAGALAGGVAGGPLIDADKLRDIVLVIEYRFAS